MIGDELPSAAELVRREQDALERLILLVASTRDLGEVLRAAVSVLIEATGADTCFLHRWDAGAGRLYLAAASPPYERLIGSVSLRLGEGIAGWVAENRLPALLPENKWADQRYKYIPELEGEKYTSLLSVPILAPEDRLVGVANMHTIARRDFTEDDLRQASVIASLIASAIENAELFRQLQEKERALEHLVRTTIDAQEEERRRVATEIHDGVTQQLVSIWYRVQACERMLRSKPEQAAAELVVTKSLIDEALGEARAAIYDLRPSTLDDLGLAPSLEALAGRAFIDPEIVVDVEAKPIPLQAHLEVALYRIAQEALSNINRHASAKSVSIRLSQRDASVLLEIEDDGTGFDVAAYRRGRHETSFGLAGIHERVRILGGELSIESGPEAGTKLSILVPIGESTGAAER